MRGDNTLSGSLLREQSSRLTATGSDVTTPRVLLDVEPVAVNRLDCSLSNFPESVLSPRMKLASLASYSSSREAFFQSIH